VPTSGPHGSAAAAASHFYYARALKVRLPRQSPRLRPFFHSLPSGPRMTYSLPCAACSRVGTEYGPKAVADLWGQLHRWSSYLTRAQQTEKSVGIGSPAVRRGVGHPGSRRIKGKHPWPWTTIEAAESPKEMEAPSPDFYGEASRRGFNSQCARDRSGKKHLGTRGHS
jgi:hypothetical protein